MALMLLLFLLLFSFQNVCALDAHCVLPFSSLPSSALVAPLLQAFAAFNGTSGVLISSKFSLPSPLMIEGFGPSNFSISARLRTSNPSDACSGLDVSASNPNEFVGSVLLMIDSSSTFQFCSPDKRAARLQNVGAVGGIKVDPPTKEGFGTQNSHSGDLIRYNYPNSNIHIPFVDFLYSDYTSVLNLLSDCSSSLQSQFPQLVANFSSPPATWNIDNGPLHIWVSISPTKNYWLDFADSIAWLFLSRIILGVSNFIGLVWCCWVLQQFVRTSKAAPWRRVCMKILERYCCCKQCWRCRRKSSRKSKSQESVAELHATMTLAVSRPSSARASEDNDTRANTPVVPGPALTPMAASGNANAGRRKTSGQQAQVQSPLTPAQSSDLESDETDPAPPQENDREQLQAIAENGAPVDLIAIPISSAEMKGNFFLPDTRPPAVSTPEPPLTPSGRKQTQSQNPPKVRLTQQKSPEGSKRSSAHSSERKDLREFDGSNQSSGSGHNFLFAKVCLSLEVAAFIARLVYAVVDFNFTTGLFYAQVGEMLATLPFCIQLLSLSLTTFMWRSVLSTEGMLDDRSWLLSQKRMVFSSTLTILVVELFFSVLRALGANNILIIALNALLYLLVYSTAAVSYLKNSFTLTRTMRTLIYQTQQNRSSSGQGSELRRKRLDKIQQMNVRATAMGGALCVWLIGAILYGIPPSAGVPMLEDVAAFLAYLAATVISILTISMFTPPRTT